MPYKDKDKQKEYSRKWEEENKEKRREDKRKWREDNKEYYKEYRELNKEKRVEYNKKYRELNNEKIREHKRERNKERRAYCLEYLGGKCVKCGTTHNLQFDHIKREGKKYNIAGRLTNDFTILKEELDKCQLLCVPCHLDKTAKEWAILRGDA